MPAESTNSKSTNGKTTGSKTTGSKATGSKTAETPAPRENAITRFFEVTARKSTVGRELRGGLVTFFTMAYIVVLNPLIIGTTKDSAGQFLGGGSTPNLQMVAAGTGVVAGAVP